MPVAMRFPKPGEKAIDYTHLEMFLTCPAAYKYRWDGGRDLEDATHKLRGACIHELFRLLFLDTDLKEDFLHKSIPTVVDKVMVDFVGAPFDRYKVEVILHDQISTSYDPFLQMIAMNGLSCEKHGEHYSVFKLGNWEVYGYMDYLLLDKFSRKAIIIDGKGSLDPNTVSAGDQLAFYTMLFMEEFGFVPETAIFFFQTGVFKKVQTYMYMKSDLGNQLNYIEVSNFKPSPVRQNMCYFCPLKRSCVSSNKRKQKQRNYIIHDPINNEVSL